MKKKSLFILALGIFILSGCSTKQWVHPTKATKKSYDEDYTYCYNNYKQYLGEPSNKTSSYSKPNNSNLGRAQSMAGASASSGLDIKFGTMKCLYDKGWKRE